MRLITFGCRLNIFESELIKEMADETTADIIVINTCAVTGEAERQCRQTIRKTKKENPTARIIVTGCAAQLNPDIYANMPEVDKVLGNREKLDKSALLGTERRLVSDISGTLPTPQLLTDFEGHSKAFLQIQQGCDNHCTFCVVPLVRGKNVGLDPDTIIKQSHIFTDKGFSEIILTGVDVTAYPYGLAVLTKRLLNENQNIKRLRFGSLDPAALADDFIDLIGNEPRLMPHFHLSIQAGDNLILKRMNRRHLYEDVVKLIQKIRSVRPTSTFGADFITGFPTETDAQFKRTMDLVLESDLTHLHVFPYSERSGTPAAKMPMVDKQIRKDRAKQLRELGEKQYSNLCQSILGKRATVLLEKEGFGFCENYVKVKTNQLDEGKIVSVLITEVTPDGLVGRT